MTTLTLSERAERETRVRSMLDDGMTVPEMASALEVSPQTMRRFLARRGWAINPSPDDPRRIHAKRKKQLPLMAWLAKHHGIGAVAAELGVKKLTAAAYLRSHDISLRGLPAWSGGAERLPADKIPASLRPLRNVE